MMNVSTYHSRSPHLATCQSLPSRRTCPRSTAKTPSWQVTLDSSRTVVFAEPSAMSRCAPGHLIPSPLSTGRMVKYIANSAAKNISSEDSQMMVPTLTRLGLLAGPCGDVCVALAVATRTLLRQHVGERCSTPRSGGMPGTSLAGPVPRRRRMPVCAQVGSIAAMKVVVFSHDADVRAQMRLASGRRPAPDVAEAEIIEVATEPALFRLLDAGGADVMVLDGEAQPAGGMGICRQAKDEIYDCPPVLLVIGRADDRWLATWSRADAGISPPIDPVALARELAALMRARAAAPAITAQ